MGNNTKPKELVVLGEDRPHTCQAFMPLSSIHRPTKKVFKMVFKSKTSQYKEQTVPVSAQAPRNRGGIKILADWPAPVCSVPGAKLPATALPVAQRRDGDAPTPRQAPFSLPHLGQIALQAPGPLEQCPGRRALQASSPSGHCHSWPRAGYLGHAQTLLLPPSLPWQGQPFHPHLGINTVSPHRSSP